MKTHLIFRLSLLAVLLGLCPAVAVAQISIYTEDATVPGTGYWTIETDQSRRDYSVVRFYTAQHEKIYEERLAGLCLDPSRGTGRCRRTAQRLSASLGQAQRATNTSMVAHGLGLDRRAQRLYAAR
ncbi:hypothetical protein [Hymenobacter elongatus]|uniref:Uncharacterized protein n=1 Tax=Hymenobacter elongatus TaxID=877208 RepID=A0A4Z0PR75_9BACT|nr:hypothetical protein [Hymenobacter elongatus]TGE20220.1 hypothetical protein E5J99_01265 [Hymenobacter elongatus]